MSAAEKELYLSDLLKTYKQGVTKETNSISKNFIITRYVVIQGTKVTEYKKAVTRGGNFYKKNGQDVTDIVFNLETKGFEK
jgi:hypothetical protein